MTRPVMRSNSYASVPAGYVSAAHGLEALFEFNGLVLNDRRWLERYHLTAITGLDDADVRDSREVNADMDGETAFPSLYGGRTITLTGVIEAGNLPYLRYMQQNLKMAFDDIGAERELHIRWYDWFDDFLADSLALWQQDYLSGYNVGTEGVSLASGSILPGTPQFAFLAKARTYADYQHTLRFRTGSSVAGGSVVRVYGTWLNTTNFMEARLTATALNIHQTSTTVGTGVSLGVSVAYTLLANTEYWLRLSQEGSFVQAQLFAADPALGTVPVAETMVGNSQGGELGAGVLGYGGFGATISAPTAWFFDSLDLRGRNPGDMTVSCKKVAKIEGAEAWTGLSYRLPFMITLRASSPLKLARLDTTLPAFKRAALMQPAQILFPAGGVGIPFDNNGAIIFGTGVGNAVNNGFAATYPTVRFAGPVTDPSVVNVLNGSRVVVSGTVASGEYIDIDCLNRTVRDNLGKNRYDLMGAENTWLVLEPGANPLSMAVRSTLAPVLTVLDTNYIENPSAEIDAGFWFRYSTDAVYPSVSEAYARYGVRSIRVTGVAAFPATGIIYATNMIASTAGQAWSLAAEFRAGTVGRSCSVGFIFYNAAGAQVGSTTNGSNITDTAVGWTRATHTATAPAATAWVQPRINTTITATNEMHYIDGIILVKGGSVPAYFDGDTTSCIWEGTPHRSRSLKINSAELPVSGPAPGTALVTWRHAYR